MSLGLMLIGAGLYLAVGHSPPSKASDPVAMPATTSKSFCLAIKAQWQTQHSWSTQDDEVLRQSFRSHGCTAHGITLP